LGPPCLFSLERARQILGELDDAENAARGLDSLRGTLRVALSGAFGIGEVIPSAWLHDAASEIIHRPQPEAGVQATGSMR
jgi:DNA-binding transcriptional LysR family regulator